METEPRVAYHGTPSIDIVPTEGLHALSGDHVCTWMALRPEDAARYGDVVEIDLSQLDGTWPREDDGSLCWQAHYCAPIPSTALSRYIPQEVMLDA